MFIQLSDRGPAHAGLLAGSTLALGVWASTAPSHIPEVGLPLLAVLAFAGTRRELGVEGRMLAWVGAGFALLLAIPLPAIWPLGLLLLLAPAAIALFAFRSLRPARAWFRVGRIEWLPIAAVGGVSILPLGLWFAFLNDDPQRFTRMLTETVPDVSWPLLLLGAVIFSVVNAVLEELLFRGFVQGALEGLMGRTLLVVLLQAALFGACHYRGFPSGMFGALMAGSWALLLGWARQRCEGLATPILAHIVADATIFALVASQL